MMATYNGERYLKEQLDSLINQSFKNWELIVSDDCSTDKTEQILKKYKEKEPRIIKIITNKKYHGPYANFFNVLNYVKVELKDKNYDYFFYCDQDDIWDKNKLFLQIEKISQYKDIPAFCYCDLRICDINCNDTGDKMSNHIRVPFIKNPYNIFFKEQYVWGTTICHNKKLWDLMNIPVVSSVKNNMTHDSYISKYATLYAKITYVPQALVYYRRIGNNVSETPHTYTIKQAFLKLITKAPKMINNAAQTYWESIYLLKNITLKNKISEDLLSCFYGNFFKKIKIINKYSIMKNENFFGKCSTFIIFYLNLYKRSSIFKLMERDSK